MLGKVATVALFAILAALGDASEGSWKEITTKWSSPTMDPFRDNSYFSVPSTLEAFETEGWVEINDGDSLRTFCLADDPRYCVLVDSETNMVSGVQVAILVSDITNGPALPTNYENNGAIIRKTLDGEEYYTSSIYFEENDDGTHRVWYENGSEVTEIPTTVDAIEKEGVYTKKSCLDGRGTVYSKIDSTTTSADLPIWNFIFNGDELAGFQFLGLGDPTFGETRKWNEWLLSTDLEDMIPDASDSLIADVKEYSSISVTTWLTEDPENIVCEE